MDISKMRFPGALTVTELNRYIKDLVDINPPLGAIYIKGEISNFKAHSSGHFYFSLKDSDSVLKAVMFRMSASRLGYMPQNGMKVVAHGRISVYERGGEYQLYADSMEPDGVGAMYMALEQLKAKLSAMGLFDESRKKPLPKIPSAVGVVTSPTGAAVRDIINVCTRRFPYARIRVYPALVQGDGAVDSVAAGIEYFNRCGGADVLIVGRGGGSIEDLWAFNSEKVAIAVSRSRIPVISAVGHETDVTICDLVADRRAPTPSAAAELAVPETAELKQKFNNVITRETAVLMGRIDAKKKELDRLAASRVLTSPAASFEDRSVTVDRLSDRLARAQNNILEKKTALLKSGAASLSALNPMAVLSRGYGAVFAADGSVIKSVESLSVGDTVKLALSDGDALCGIKEIELGSDNAHGKHERKGDCNE